MTAIHE